jgi:hypothetical protein
MDYHKIITVVVILSCLFGCGKSDPAITIPADKADYFGVWEYKYNEFGNNIKSDNMLLVFYKDSSVSYKRCINRLNGHKSTTVPEAVITKLTDTELVISANIIITSLDISFVIEQPPYLDEGVWKMKVDGALLKKLSPGEQSDHETWKCGEQEEEPTNANSIDSALST